MYTVYLSGEIHSSWRQEIIDATQDLSIRFTAPVTDHPASDAAGDFWDLLSRVFGETSSLAA